MTKVQTMEAYRRPMVCEWSVTAKNRVLPYMTTRRTAPQAARIRLIFSIVKGSFLKRGWDKKRGCDARGLLRAAHSRNPGIIISGNR